jgi:hypothetical protein
MNKRQHSSLMPYDSLPENEKEQNRNNVRDIPNKLAMAGFTFMPARGNESQDDFTAEEIEKLAETEHERWMKQKYAEGWKYAVKTNKSRKLHKALVGWAKLPESERAKDRVLVEGIPRILAKAGYTMVRLKA